MWDRNVGVPKMAQSDVPNSKFRFFPRWSLWLGGGGGPGQALLIRGRGGGLLALRPTHPKKILTQDLVREIKFE